MDKGLIIMSIGLFALSMMMLTQGKRTKHRDGTILFIFGLVILFFSLLVFSRGLIC